MPKATNSARCFFLPPLLLRHNEQATFCSVFTPNEGAGGVEVRSGGWQLKGIAG